MEINPISQKSTSLSRFLNIKTAIGILCVVIIFVIYLLFLAPPRTFKNNSIISVDRGQTLSSLSLQLQNDGYVRSSFLFKLAVYVFNGKGRIIAGNYHFSSPENILTVAYRISLGRFDEVLLRVTIPEGSSSKDIANILAAKISGFDKEDFLKKASKKEGYLFPDTYHLGSNMTTDEIISTMEDNFYEKIASDDVQAKIKSFGKPLSDVIKMASILEGEARLFETKRMVAGILWKRISLGMPLQVDTTFKYFLGKTTYELTTSDLEIDSPYNSYTNVGFPPTPISNPGIQSILAAVTPIKTNYLYFLTDANGNMHYAKTHDEHVVNKARYLK